MRKNIITLLLILIFLASCGAQVKNNEEPVAQPQPTPVTIIIPEESVESVESIDTAIEEEGFTLDTFDTNSQKTQKQSLNSIRLIYSTTQEVNISTHTLYSITNEENQSIIVTVDNLLLDGIENNPSFVIHHRLPIVPYGFTNLNTTLTEENATITTILEEIEKAFTQKVLNNPLNQRVIYNVINDENQSTSESIDDQNTTTSEIINDNNTTVDDNNITTKKILKEIAITQSIYRIVDDVNVTYQTAFKNHDETFECNGESKIIDAKTGSTILKDLSVGTVLCTFGVNKIPMFDFNVTQKDTTAPLITLNGESNITLIVGEAYIELGATAIDNVDGNLSVSISGKVNINKLGIYLITYTAEDLVGNVAKKSREIQIKSSETIDSTPFIEEAITEEENEEEEEEEV